VHCGEFEPPEEAEDCDSSATFLRDVRIDTYRNGVEVRITMTHIPTGKQIKGSGSSEFDLRSRMILLLEQTVNEG